MNDGYNKYFPLFHFIHKTVAVYESLSDVFVSKLRYNSPD